MKVGEIVAKLATNGGMKTADLATVVADLFAGIRRAVEQGEKVSIDGFGTFVYRTSEAGEKIKSTTGAVKVTEAESFIAFKPAKADADGGDPKFKKEKKTQA